MQQAYTQPTPPSPTSVSESSLLTRQVDDGQDDSEADSDDDEQEEDVREVLLLETVIQRIPVVFGHRGRRPTGDEHDYALSREMDDAADDTSNEAMTIEEEAEEYCVMLARMERVCTDLQRDLVTCEDQLRHGEQYLASRDAYTVIGNVVPASSGMPGSCPDYLRSIHVFVTSYHDALYSVIRELM